MIRVGLPASPPPRTAVSFPMRVCGFRTRSSPTPGVGLGGRVLRPKSVVLGWLPITSSDFHDCRKHGPCMRIDGISAPRGRFVARASASVATVHCRPGLGDFHSSPPTPLSLRFLSYAQGATRALQTPPLQRRLSPSALLSRRALDRKKIPP